MDRRDTPPKWVTPPTWGPPPPCKQALTKPVVDLPKSYLWTKNEGNRFFQLLPLVGRYFLTVALNQNKKSPARHDHHEESAQQLAQQFIRSFG